MTNQSLSDIMALGVHKPVGSQGATLALALHCLMVREGFSVVDNTADTAPRRSSYAPPYGWRSHSASEWEFKYTRDGKANTFLLIISLHPDSGRIFVHASEHDSTINIQVLGLQLENYVPDAAFCAKATQWEGIMANEEVLAEQFQTHITCPLIDQAEDLSPRMLYNPQQPPSRTGSAWLSGFNTPQSIPTSSPYLWAGIVAAAAGATLALFALRRSWTH